MMVSERANGRERGWGVLWKFSVVELVCEWECMAWHACVMSNGLKFISNLMTFFPFTNTNFGYGHSNGKKHEKFQVRINWLMLLRYLPSFLSLQTTKIAKKKYPCSLVFFFSYLWNEFAIHWVIPIWRVNDFQVLSRQFISCNEEKRKYSFRITKKILIKHSMDKIHVVLQIKSISQF